jgi:hypothetical protein
MKVIVDRAICTHKDCHLKGQLQPASNFHKSSSSRNGLNNYCKDCIRKGNKKYKKEHKDEIKKYEQEHKEMRRQIQYNCNHRNAYYDTYASQLEPYYNVRRDPEDNQFIQVSCDNCDKLFTPKNNEVKNRLASINGLKGKQGESRLYCSEECKLLCPVYNQTKYLKFQKTKSSYRELQYQLRTMVLKRDENTCQICGATNCRLICHHMTGVEINPIESADIDNSITLCQKCELHVHTLPGCRRVDMRCSK